MAIGGGVGLIVWGVQKVWTKDDSADERVQEFLQSLPEKIRKYVDSVEVTDKGMKVTLRQDAPVDVQKEIETHVVTV
jgi:hypothetical protein